MKKLILWMLTLCLALSPALALGEDSEPELDKFLNVIDENALPEKNLQNDGNQDLVLNLLLQQEEEKLTGDKANYGGKVWIPDAANVFGMAGDNMNLDGGLVGYAYHPIVGDVDEVVRLITVYRGACEAEGLVTKVMSDSLQKQLLGNSALVGLVITGKYTRDAYAICGLYMIGNYQFMFTIAYDESIAYMNPGVGSSAVTVINGTAYHRCINCNGMKKCPYCLGSGRYNYGAGYETCVACKGTGVCNVCNGVGFY